MCGVFRDLVRFQSDKNEIIGRIFLTTAAHPHRYGTAPPAARSFDDEPAACERLILGAPRDEGDIRPRRREDSAQIAADRTGTENQCAHDDSGMTAKLDDAGRQREQG